MYFSEINSSRYFSNGVKRTRKIFREEEPFEDNWKGWVLPNKRNIPVNKEKNPDNFIKSLYQFVYVFFSTSTIHGLYHLTPIDRHWIEHCLWIICIILGMCGCAYISSHSWNRYQNDPTVISMERDYKTWNTSLPSITICPNNKIDQYSVEPGDIPLDKETLTNFLEDLAMTSYDNFGEMDDDIPSIKADDYMNLTYKYRYKYSHATNPYINTDNGYPVASIIEYGICYIYNSEVSFSLTAPYFFAKDFDDLPANISREIAQAGRLDGDLIGQIQDINSGFMVAFTGPGEIPDASSPWKDYSYGTFIYVELVGLSIYSSEDVKSLSVKQRKCKFLNEFSGLRISKVYSYNLCRMECRMNLAEKLCNCIPHFYRKLDGRKICEVADFPCLAQHEVYLMTLRNETTNEKVPCECLPPCNDVNYYIDFEKIVPWPLGTTFKWGIVKYPKYRLKREIIFSFSDLLVSIGGTAGLFLGCSFLSFIEIIYFLTLRLIFYICKRR